MNKAIKRNIKISLNGSISLRKQYLSNVHNQNRIIPSAFLAKSKSIFSLSVRMLKDSVYVVSYHSFILTIYIAPLQDNYSEALVAQPWQRRTLSNVKSLQNFPVKDKTPMQMG